MDTNGSHEAAEAATGEAESLPNSIGYVDIAPCEIKAALRIAATDDVRYYLCGICIDTTGPEPVAVVTDGARLLAINIGECGTLPPGQYIVPGTALRAVKARRRDPSPLRIEFAVAGRGAVPTFVIRGGVAEISGKCIDGKYPDWRRIVPRQLSRVVAQFNADYLASFAAAARDLSGKEAAQPSIGHNGDGPALLNLQCGDRAVALLMPMRTDPVGDDLPAWLGL